MRQSGARLLWINKLSLSRNLEKRYYILPGACKLIRIKMAAYFIFPLPLNGAGPCGFPGGAEGRRR
jgi:hypothetical protein